MEVGVLMKGSKSSIVAASKETERRVARVYGGRRLTAGEWNGAGDVDVISPLYAIQVKHRKNVADYILEGMRQAQEGADDTDEIARISAGVPYGEIKLIPDPLLVIVTKPGRGKPSRMFKVEEIYDPTD